MEWSKLLDGLATSSPLAGVLGYGCFWLAERLKESRAETKAAQSEVARLNEARIADLRAILKPDD